MVIFKEKETHFWKKAIMIIQFIAVDSPMAIGLNDVFFFVLNGHAFNGGFCGFCTRDVLQSENAFLSSLPLLPLWEISRYI